MPKFFSQSLPYRRLQKFANGIWDEERKVFYPFKTSVTTVPAKKNIHYYVKSVTIQATNAGDSTVKPVNVQATINGIVSYLGYVAVPVSTAALLPSTQTSAKFDVNVLCSPNTAITKVSNATSAANTLIVYAEIPADPAGGPVVIS